MKRFLALLSLILFVCSPSARAENFTITSGQFNAVRNVSVDAPVSNLTGPQINLNVGRGITYDLPVPAGVPLQLRGYFDSTDFGAVLLPPLTLNGVTVNGPLFGNGSPSPYFNILFVTPVFIGPPSIYPGFNFVAPFTATAFFDVNVPGQSPQNTLSGAGTVFAEFERDGQTPRYIFRRATYTFGPVAPSAAVIPTPEPASMVLLGTGLAGFVGSAVRRRRRHQK